MASLAPPLQQASPSPRVSAELDSQAPTLTPPTAHSSPRHEHATLPPEEPAFTAAEPEAPAAAQSSEPTPAPTESLPKPTDVAVTFLLISGARKSMHFAPTMTFGRVKEAFWSAWTPENATEKPPAPSFLRVLHMGKILSDDQTLTAAKFPNVSTSPGGTIVHISVRPFGPPTDEDIVKAKRRSRRFLSSDSGPVNAGSAGPGETHGRSGGCGCLIC